MEHPNTIIDRICSAKGVEERDVLRYLLLHLTQSHGLYASVPTEPGQPPLPRLVRELQGAAQLLGTETIPNSVLEAVHNAVSVQYIAERFSREQAKKNPALDPGGKALKSASIAETALLIIRELLNQTDNQALRAEVHFDQFRGPDGSIDVDRLIKGDEEKPQDPPAPAPPKDE